MRRLASALFLALMRLAAWLPYERRIPLVGRVVAAVAGVAGWRRRIAANLDHAWPDLPAPERGRLLRAVPDNAGRALAELYAGPEFTARVQASDLSGPGLPALDAALAEGRPVIVAAAHFGNYDAMRTALVKRGFRVGALYRPMNDAAFNAHYIPAMAAIATPIFPVSRQGIVDMVRHLRGGGLLCLGFDQFSQKGARLSFFGREAATVLTPAELALAHGALLLPVHAVRRADGLSFDVRAGAPVAPATPEAMMQALNDDLEALVRAHPEQWFWVHRRWKPGRWTAPTA